MIKSELIERIAAQNPHLYQRDVEKIVNTILDTITTALARGDRVELPDPASPLVERIRTSVLSDREVMDGPYGPAVVHAASVSD